jgi:hypothetical protein
MMNVEALGILEELMRETFEGGLPGQGTQYLDHRSGIRATLAPLSAAQASRSRNGHPSIAAHARHMLFHLRVSSEWIQGDHSQRDWIGSFKPSDVTEEEWARILEDLEAARTELMWVLRGLPAERLAQEGAGFGSLAHLAYHLGAIRQLAHDITS